MEGLEKAYKDAGYAISLKADKDGQVTFTATKGTSMAVVYKAAKEEEVAALKLLAVAGITTASVKDKLYICIASDSAALKIFDDYFGGAGDNGETGQTPAQGVSIESIRTAFTGQGYTCGNIETDTEGGITVIAFTGEKGTLGMTVIKYPSKELADVYMTIGGMMPGKTAQKSEYIFNALSSTGRTADEDAAVAIFNGCF